MNFARASEYLNVTQSAVSRQIHALEGELNTKLFYRTTRTVALTPDGVIFLEHAKHILGQLKIAMAKIQHHSNSHTRVLTIGCDSELDVGFLLDLLTECRRQITAFHPFLKIISHRALLDQFYQGELEVLFGFRESLPIKSDVVFIELGKIPLCGVFPRAHAYAKRETVGVEELVAEPFIICNSHALPAKVMELQNQVAQRIAPEHIYLGETVQSILALVRTGYGCSILPKAALRDEAIVPVPLEHTPPLAYGMLYSKGYSNPLLKEFIALAKRMADT